MTDDLRARIATAIREAAYSCDDDCGKPETECDADHPIQIAVWHRGIVTDVTGPIDALADAVLATVQPIADELAENEGVIKALRRQRDEAEAAVGRIRDKATEWTALAPADDWGMTPRDTVLADAGRYLLALIDRPERTAPNNTPAGSDTVDNPKEQA